MPNEPDEEIVSSEALVILGYADSSSVRHLVRTGVLKPSRKLPGQRGAYLFKRADVIEVAAKKRADYLARAAAIGESLGGDAA